MDRTQKYHPIVATFKPGEKVDLATIGRGARRQIILHVLRLSKKARNRFPTEAEPYLHGIRLPMAGGVFSRATRMQAVVSGYTQNAKRV